MPRPTKLYFQPEKAKRHLRWLLAAFVIALSLPVYLLLDKVYAQLENESWFNQRNQAEVLLDSIEQRLQETVAEEENRPIAEYSFFNILENPLLNSTAIKFSPLSEVPPKTNMPGLTGFFQIKPDNSFHIPALPELEQDYQPVLSLEELEKRITLREKLRRLLMITDTSTEEATLGGRKTEQRDDRDTKSVSSPEYREGYRLDDVFSTAETDAISAERSHLKNQAKKDKVFSSVGKNKQLFSEEKLKELNIDAEQWKQQHSDHEARNFNKREAASESFNQSRKEIVHLPDQSLAGALFKRPSRQSPTSPSPDAIEEAEAIPSVAQQSGLSNPQIPLEQPTLKVLSIESEVSPLQMILLKDGYLCFYRRVWHENGRYIQGFIVSSREFFTAAVRPFLDSSPIPPFTSLLIAFDGKLLEQFKSSSYQQESLLYRTSLDPPFQHLELIINTGSLSVDTGSLVIDLLAAALGLVLVGGVLLFYHLSSRQIELATQQRNFVSAVSHELKTPLTSIRMYGEMLRSQWITDESRKKTYYNYIFFESERLSRLISNILLLAKMENHSEKTKLCPHDPCILLHRITEKTQLQTKASGFLLNIIPPDTMKKDSFLLVDEDAFFQIMINLVDNAIKFSENADKKVIDVGLKIYGHSREAIFFVRDYGPGIEKKQMRKIFRLFYRAGDELTRTAPGTGIGLALVSQLTERMNAKIDLINRNPGIEFQIIFMLKNKKLR